MAKFLSAEWFDALGKLSEADGSRPELVVEVAVPDAPGGEVRYDLVVEGGSARVVKGTAWPAQVRISADYETISAIASGGISAYDALAAGRAKFSGSTSAISSLAEKLAGADLVPPALRASTTY